MPLVYKRSRCFRRFDLAAGLCPHALGELTMLPRSPACIKVERKEMVYERGKRKAEGEDSNMGGKEAKGLYRNLDSIHASLL